MDALALMATVSGPNVQATASQEGSFGTNQQSSYAEVEALLMQTMPVVSNLNGRETPGVIPSAAEGRHLHLFGAVGALGADGEGESSIVESDWVEHMQQNPEQVQEWLNNHISEEAVQQWLTQALEPLVALQQEQSAGRQQLNLTDSSLAVPPESIPAAVPVKEAQAVVHQLLQELQKQPDHIWLGQLSQMLQRMMRQGVNQATVLGISENPTQDPAVKAFAVRQVESPLLIGNKEGNIQAELETKSIIWSTRMMQTGDEAKNRLAFLAARHISFDRMTGQSTIRLDAVEQIASELNQTLHGSQPILSFSQPVTQLSMPSTAIPKLVNTQSFLQDMSQYVMNNFRTTTMNGITEARFSLSPEHLGHVNITLTMHNGQLAAQFVAHSLLGREMLEGQMGMLRHALQNQGFHVERLEVVHSDAMSSSMYQQSHHQQPGHAPQETLKHIGGHSSEEGIDGWADELSLTEGAGEMAIRLRLSNSDFDVTA